MKYTYFSMTLVFSLFGIASAAPKTPVEHDAIISDTDDIPKAKMLELVDPAVSMIRANGWRCDSVSSFQPFPFSRGFTMVCNNYSYSYKIRDRGGNWIVELK